MKTITIDQKSIQAAASGQLDLESIVADLKMPASNDVAKCVAINDEEGPRYHPLREGDHGYILSRDFQAGDGLLTISLEPDGPLTALEIPTRQEALGRLLRCSMALFSGRSRAIPISWRPFHYKNMISFQADRRERSSQGGRTKAGRIILEMVKETGIHIYAFMLDADGEQDIQLFRPNRNLYLSASKHIVAAIAVSAPPEKVEPKAEIAGRAETDPAHIGQAVELCNKVCMLKTTTLLDDWYNSRLTADQRRFVDYPFTSSVRLVGPAGSGKTLALVVKCLRQLHESARAKTAKRFLFLTHASSTASATEGMVLGMDPEDGLSFLASNKPALTITTLYALANEQMRYDLCDLSPVSLDGHKGRDFQAEVLNSVIEDYRNADWIIWRAKCSQPFVSYMEAPKDSKERRFFLWELLNEFACVLDAEGIRSGGDRRDKYLRDARKAWMLLLQTREEREVVLQLYDKFRTFLRDIKAIGGDQMITDFLNHLDSFRWEATRAQEGFDAIFVDELHLFNRQERMIFSRLVRDVSQPPIVFMAYDAKQSPMDTFLGVPRAETARYDLWKDARLGKVEKIELLDVFRYTPQITEALACIDRSFPGQDLDSDWPPYSGIAKTKDGPIPILCELATTITTYAKVFKRAEALQKKLGKSGRVAVLCASSGLFQRYLERPELRDLFYAITSRDEALGMLYNAKKFIFSMPEYVAGLQYDTVMLIEVNHDEIPDGPYSASAQRKFASQVYLGASRAEHRLEIYASQEHGGISSMMSVAVMTGAIKKIDGKDI